MKKRIFTLIAAAVMLTGITACGQNTTPDSAPESTAAAEQSAAESSQPAIPAGADALPADDSWEPADSALGLPALDLGMTTEEMCRRAVLNTGNRARLANVMKKAQNNEAVTFGVIGGSITQGTGAQSSQETYAYRTMAWWVKAFPKASVKLQYVNAGIGATGSYIGVHRLERDLLSQKPDVVVVEFSVNDTEPLRDLQSYDSLVRRILEQDNQPAVILLFMTQENGTSLYDTHRKIGEAYDLPMISYRNAVMPEIRAGSFTWQDISPDNIHPNSSGHGIAAELLWSYFNSVYAALETIDTDDLSFTAEPVSDDRYQHPQILDSETAEVTESDGFEPAELNQSFPHNWKGTGSISFNVTAQNIGILYQRTVDGSCGKYEVLVDGEVKRTLDGNFAGGWGNYAESAEIFVSDDAQPHEVTLRPAESNDGKSFELLGLLVS